MESRVTPQGFGGAEDRPTEARVTPAGFWDGQTFHVESPQDY
jgi:hypothetical protein